MHLKAMRLPLPVREFRPFPDGRRWRLDLAWHERTPRLYVEVQGGEMMQGRHARGVGMAADCEKAALLTLDGWIGFTFTGGQVRNGFALDILTRYFNAHP